MKGLMDIAHEMHNELDCILQVAVGLSGDLKKNFRDIISACSML